MSSFEAIDPTKIDELLKPKPQASRGRRAKGPITRDLPSWFTVLHRFGECSNSDCLDPMANKGMKSSPMIATISELDMCRWCFLGSYGVKNES